MRDRICIISFKQSCDEWSIFFDLSQAGKEQTVVSDAALLQRTMHSANYIARILLSFLSGFYVVSKGPLPRVPQEKS